MQRRQVLRFKPMLNPVPWMIEGAFLLQVGCAFGAWALIIARILHLSRASAANREFSAAFRKALNLQAASGVFDNGGGYARIANAGFGTLRHARSSVRAEGALHRYTLLVRNLTRQVRRECDALSGGLASLACVIGISFVTGLLRQVGNSPAFDELGMALTLSVLPGSLLVRHQVNAMCAGLDDFANDFLDLARQSLCESCDAQEVRPARGLSGPHPSSRLQLVTSTVRKVPGH